jgi:hypothetical protein
MENDAERGRTLDEAIEELEGLRRMHGGSVEMISSTGSVGFRFISFSQEEKEREGIQDFIGIMTGDGRIL